MCQTKTRSEKTPSAIPVDRPLLDAIVRLNPLVALGAALVVPIVRLLGRRKPAPAAVRKQKLKLESDSYSPLAAESSGQGASKKDPREIQEGSSSSFGETAGRTLRRPPSPVSGQKGGHRHGQD